jgi:cbb3-type cytochrome oxidase maturation protein
VGNSLMSILSLMIPIAILLGGSFLAAFIWATTTGQFDDTITPAHRILANDQKEDSQ